MTEGDDATQDGAEGQSADGFLSTIRQLAGGISAEELLFGLALAVVVALLVAYLTPGLNQGGRVIVGLASLVTVLLIGFVSLRAVRRHSEPLREPTQSSDLLAAEAAVPELVIAKNGRFVGGDKVATDVVMDVLDVPAADRSVRIRSLLLEDKSYKHSEPDRFAKLRRNIQSYELSTSRLLRGSVHYYYKWKESQLAEAVLELRRFALPGIEHADRERFYVWPPTDPSRVVEVRLDTSNVEWLQTGSYGQTPNSRRRALGRAAGRAHLAAFDRPLDRVDTRGSGRTDAPRC